MVVEKVLDWDKRLEAYSPAQKSKYKTAFDILDQLKEKINEILEGIPS